jgi:uncharacterized protein YnzC (UPF0291/DUF896 family)
MVANTETAIWERVIDPNEDDLSPEAARFLLRLDFGEPDHARMEELAQKSNDGTLTADERLELQNYVRIGNVLALMQSKARLSLHHTARAS